MTSDDFKQLFTFPLGFSSPISWTDGVGFSAIQDYNDGYASIYKLGLVTEDLNKEITRLWASVSYGKITSGGISLGTGVNGFHNPVDVDFNNEYSYNSELNKFYYEDKEIEPSKIILNIEEVHRRPTRKDVSGILLRSRLWFWRKAIPTSIKFIDHLLNCILWIMSGERAEKDIWHRLLRLDSKEDTPIIKFKEAEVMDFFGYRAKRWSIVFYCVVNLILYVIFYLSGIHPVLLGKIFSNNFLSLCYVILTFEVAESFLPKIIKFSIIQVTPKMFGRISFKRLKIKNR